jgi:hypothetical protein
VKFAASKKRLQVAIDAYRAKAGDDLDQHGHKVLDRFAADERAADAFAKFNVDDAAAASILTACIEGDLLRRTFPDRISAEQAMLARLEQLDKAIADLRTFVAELSQGPSDTVSG